MYLFTGNNAIGKLTNRQIKSSTGTAHVPSLCNISIGASLYNLHPSFHSHKYSQLLCKHLSCALDFVSIFHFLGKNFAQQVPIHNDAIVM